MKISIVYVSQSGNTEVAAEYIEEGILARFPFAQVKLMSIKSRFKRKIRCGICNSPVSGRRR